MPIKQQKISRAKAINILKKFIKEELPKKRWFLKIEKHIKADIFYGSRSKNIHKINSDIDMLIILPLNIEKKYTVGEYIFEYKGFEINIVIRSIERLRKLAEKQNNLFEAEVFRMSEIVWQRDDETKKLIGKIKNPLF